MTGFASQALEKKLLDLNNSQQSIQTLSLWLIHHRKHHKSIVQTWFKELKKAKPNRKLTFMYLANDVIQNSRKKGPEFSKEFGAVLKASFENVAKDSDDKTLGSLDRILTIWETRAIYDETQIANFKSSLNLRKNQQSVKDNSVSNAVEENNNKHNKEKRLDNHKKDSQKNSKEDKKVTEKVEKQTKKRLHEVTKEIPLKKKPNIELSSKKSTVIQNQIKPKAINDKFDKKAVVSTPITGPAVDPEVLIKALQELENSASADATIRQKIASLPTEVFDATLLDKIRDKSSADRLTKLVEEARSILTNYNNRLSQELEDRKQISTLLSNYTQSQREALLSAEQKLTEYRDKLRKVTQVRNELKSHLQNLPDLSRLPSVTGLAPLPSACDLFNVGRMPNVSAGSVTSSVSPNESNASPADYDTFHGTPSSNTS